VLILDTNVISELAKREPDKAVLNWADKQATGTLWSTTITEAEILLGLELLPIGRRRDDLERAMTSVFAGLLSGRILPFDGACTKIYAQVICLRRGKGKSISTADMQIAAIAKARNAVVVTRNTNDFSDCGLTLINPWVPM
jgi:toxin FitB